MPIQDTLTNINTTISGVTNQFDTGVQPPTQEYELSEIEMRRRNMARIIVIVVILGIITGLILKKVAKK